MDGFNLVRSNEELSQLGMIHSSQIKGESRLFSRLLELHCLYQITAILSEKMDVDAAVKTLKRLFQFTFQLDHFALLLVEADTQELRFRNTFGLKPPLRMRFRLDENIFGKVLRNGEPLYVPNIQTHLLLYDFYPPLDQSRGSLICLPLRSNTTGEPLGAFILYRTATDSFSSKEIDLFSKIGRQVACVLDKALLYQHTRALTVTDELTGIANRRYFNQRYEREFLRSERYNRALSVIMVDIDHFKNYNDTHGHLRGDEILRKVARVLEKNLRKADLVARFGGEEFIVLLPETDKARARNVAEKLRHRIETYSFPDGHSQPLGRVTISLGLASYPEDASSSRALLEVADRMLYLAKSMGRNQLGFVEEKTSCLQPGHRARQYVTAGS